MTDPDLHALEWSHRSNSFHVQSLAASLTSALRAFDEDRITHWVVISVGTLDEMEALADQLRPLLTQRHVERKGQRP